jgi:hypothetical protein
LYRRAVATSGANATDFGFAMTTDTNDNIILVAYSDDSTTGYDMVMLRVDNQGDLDTTFNPTGSIPGDM